MGQTLKASGWDAQEGYMCPNHTTHVSVECKPLVASILTMTQCAPWTSPAKATHMSSVCVCMHPNSISNLHPLTSMPVTAMPVISSQILTKQIACCNLGTLPLLNGPPTLHLQKRHAHACAASFVMQMRSGCPVLSSLPHPTPTPTWLSTHEQTRTEKTRAHPVGETPKV